MNRGREGRREEGGERRAICSQKCVYARDAVRGVLIDSRNGTPTARVERAWRGLALAFLAREGRRGRVETSFVLLCVPVAEGKLEAVCCHWKYRGVRIVCGEGGAAFPSRKLLLPSIVTK